MEILNETKKSKHYLSCHRRNSDSQLTVSLGDSEQAGLQESSTSQKRRLDSRKQASQPRSSKLVVSGELEKFPLGFSVNTFEV